MITLPFQNFQITGLLTKYNSKLGIIFVHTQVNPKPITDCVILYNVNLANRRSCFKSVFFQLSLECQFEEIKNSFGVIFPIPTWQLFEK